MANDLRTSLALLAICTWGAKGVEVCVCVCVLGECVYFYRVLTSFPALLATLWLLSTCGFVMTKYKCQKQANKLKAEEKSG